MDAFYFKGKPILDIEKFCKEHQTKLIEYKAERRIPNIFSGKIEKETKKGKMPEIFFDTLRMTNGWYYTKL